MVIQSTPVPARTRRLQSVSTVSTTAARVASERIAGYSTQRARGVSALADDVLQYAAQPFEAFVQAVHAAPPMQLLHTERAGVDAAFLGDLARRMDVSVSHLAEAVGIPKATAARKLARHENIDGAAAIALARLLALAGDIVADSTAPEAASFDTARWLGQWIERPQPALGGCKPSELLDTPTGVAMVTKLLGAMRSGAYQ